MDSLLRVPDLPAFRRDLRQLENPRRWALELAAANREIGKQVAGWAKSEAQSMGGAQRHFAAALAGGGGATGAKVRVKDPAANAAFWGAEQRTGWNAGNDERNQSPWVTDTWTLGASSSDGPYAIAPAVFEHVDDISQAYADAVAEVALHASQYFTETF